MATRLLWHGAALKKSDLSSPSPPETAWTVEFTDYLLRIISEWRVSLLFTGNICLFPIKILFLPTSEKQQPVRVCVCVCSWVYVWVLYCVASGMKHTVYTVNDIMKRWRGPHPMIFKKQTNKTKKHPTPPMPKLFKDSIYSTNYSIIHH